MKSYIVGGAVRDSLLGLPVQDRDWVVIGATPEDMLAQGYRPVGKDFPVFLHPVTHEEYALARTERKTAPGYRGFVFHAAPEVTLEQDLVRRDLTINAMARADDGTLVDPFGGQRDVRDKVFRHVSDAFLEDPVRILRLARFAARFADFTVAPETLALMRSMVAAGEVDALVAERVWQELARGLMEARPSRMFAVLRDCGALVRILPELDALWPGAAGAAPAVLQMLDHAAACALPLCGRFAVLMRALGGDDAHAALASIDTVCARLKVPSDCRDLAVMHAREDAVVQHAAGLTAADLVALLVRCDALRKPERFVQMLEVAACEHGGQPGAAWAPAARLHTALTAARAVPAGDVAARCGDDKAAIPAAVHAARIDAVNARLSV
ncbi:multifunctional CCA addition/repair protein [Massilia sp. CF038]|uniref:multifunctional CCA addition/repair protein n=1 Tax=Massilia sp. CF038 TaxID=1881045 RepID=UPI0009236F52|nr:multifunctional CCA addition/repair protein [Massilia sp. CF038]SHH39368.1 tRNA nucleotidyltransferase (CCA-adding enzyme) [Massilia sp. CF038]